MNYRKIILSTIFLAVGVFVFSFGLSTEMLKIHSVDNPSNYVSAAPKKVACGDGVCKGKETCDTCPADCGECPYCGDGICNGTEACSACPEDCGECQSPAGGTIIPLYTYPTVDAYNWNRVYEAKANNPDLGVILIVNPGVYMGGICDATYKDAIDNLRSVGVNVLGYVSTCFPSTTDLPISTQLAAWQDCNLDGIFLDCYASGYSDASSSFYIDSYYETETAGYNFIVGNPGGDPRYNYGTDVTDLVDVLCLYESSGVPSVSTMESVSSYYGKERTYFLPHTTSFDSEADLQQWISVASSYADWIFVTDLGMPNPWANLPSYFEEMIAFLAG